MTGLQDDLQEMTKYPQEGLREDLHKLNENPLEVLEESHEISLGVLQESNDNSDLQQQCIVQEIDASEKQQLQKIGKISINIFSSFCRWTKCI